MSGGETASPHLALVANSGALVEGLVDAYAPGLENPQLLAEFSLLQEHEKVGNSGDNAIRFSPWRHFQDDDATGAVGRKPQHMPEVVIERDQRTIFLCADLKQILIRST